MDLVNIGEKSVGIGQPCFIIAEAGVNHNGKLSLARQMIDVAVDSGADAVKFQTFNTERLVTLDADKAEYQKKTTGTEESQYEMLKKLELSEKTHYELMNHAEKKGIILLSTPYDKESVQLLVQLGMSAIKISSADITNHPLLSYVAEQMIPIILSTGMSTLEEVEEALQVILEHDNKQIILMHCSFNYPARMSDINLRAMNTLLESFDLPTGYSDHTPGFEISVAAVALGATVIEKHFTLDRDLPGPDHLASLEPDELNQMVEKIRNVECALGSSIKQPSGAEIENLKISRRSLVAASDINKGTIITTEMIDTKRPGTGISPKYWKELIGRLTTDNIKKDELITWDKVE